MNRLSVLVITALFAALTACPGSGGGAPEPVITEVLPRFQKPPTTLGGDTGLNTNIPDGGTVAGGGLATGGTTGGGTVGDGSGGPDINVNLPPPGLTIQQCSDANKAGLPMPVGCEALFAEAASAAAKNFSESMKAAGDAVNSAMSGFKMPSFPGVGAAGPVDGKDVAPPVEEEKINYLVGMNLITPQFTNIMIAAFTLPEGCHQDGDVSLALTDLNLRAAVRKVVGNEKNEVSLYEAVNLKQLNLAQSATVQGFSSLTGLNCFVNLESLDITGHPVKSLETLSSLKHLKYLFIGKTYVTGLSPLQNLPLARLVISGDAGITDITPIINNTSIAAAKDEIGVLANNIPLLKACQVDELKNKGVTVTNNQSIDCKAPCGSTAGSGYDPMRQCVRDIEKVGVYIWVKGTDAKSQIHVAFLDGNGVEIGSSDAYSGLEPLDGSSDPGYRSIGLKFGGYVIPEPVTKISTVRFEILDPSYGDLDYKFTTVRLVADYWYADVDSPNFKTGFVTDKGFVDIPFPGPFQPAGFVDTKLGGPSVPVGPWKKRPHPLDPAQL